jgi:hypothetical protein
MIPPFPGFVKHFMGFFQFPAKKRLPMPAVSAPMIAFPPQAGKVISEFLRKIKKRACKFPQSGV